MTVCVYVLDCMLPCTEFILGKYSTEKELHPQLFLLISIFCLLLVTGPYNSKPPRLVLGHSAAQAVFDTLPSSGLSGLCHQA